MIKSSVGAIAPFLLLSLLLASPAAAQIDRVEHQLGATNLGAQSGNGGLTLGLAPAGEVTVLG